ncbi:MAG TPA: BatD family protein, partial [Solimonas sp.]
MKNRLRNSTFAALLLWSLCAQAAVTAQLDREQMQPGESVQLNLERDGSGGAEPDLSPLKKDFDVLGRSSGSSIQIINGSISRHKSVRVTLSPKRSGTLTIPPISWGGEQTRALQIVVTAGGGSQAQANGTNSPHVFFTTTLDESQPYVQSALLLTVRLHTDLPLRQASLDFGGNTDVLVQQIGQDQQSQETRDGHAFNVVERQYLLQPQHSGTVTLDGPTLDAEVTDNGGGGPFGNNPFFSGMLGSTRPIRLHGKPIELEVRPRPAAAKGSDWLPARSLTLEHSLSADPATLHAGDPLTLHLHLRAAGLSGTQLPDLGSKLRLPDGVKAYPDQAKLDNSVEAGGIVGTRDQDIALIASRPGRYQLPELRVPWWDSKAGVQREIILPAVTLEVAAASGAAPQAPPSANAGRADKSATSLATKPSNAPLDVGRFSF